MGAYSGLRTVAIFEAAKGLLVLGAGLGALELLHTDAQAFAEEIVRHLHLNPARHYLRIFLHLAEQATPAHLWLLAAGALCYALLHFIEAYGLWRERRWAEWLALVISGSYLPIEAWELHKGLSWPRVTLLVANLVIVLYLARTLVRTRGHESNLGEPSKHQPDPESSHL